MFDELHQSTHRCPKFITLGKCSSQVLHLTNRHCVTAVKGSRGRMVAQVLATLTPSPHHQLS